MVSETIKEDLSMEKIMMMLKEGGDTGYQNAAERAR